MKKLILSLFLFTGLVAGAQVKVTQGNNSPQFVLTKKPIFTSFNSDNADYFVISRTEHFEKINTLIIADKSGSITTSKDIRVNMGLMNNNFDVKNLVVVGNTPVLFVENHVKDGGKNILTARAIDNNGDVAAAGAPVGSIDFTKMSNAGDWYAALSPDKKHVSVIGVSPYQKNTAQQIQYYILDENLKELSKGQFSFAGNTKQLSVTNFLTSDKGDIYIVSDDDDKFYKLPVLYKYAPGSQPMVIPVMMADPDMINLSYTLKVGPSGDLIIGGYYQKKKAFSGEPQALGSYLFNSSKPNEVKTFNFDKPAINLVARNLVYNGDTFYLIGEKYKTDKQPYKGSPLSPMALVDVFDYIHGDVIVIGYTLDFTKKFDMSISRKWIGQDMDQDLMVASGVINNKLALIYVDQYGKYIKDFFRKENKLPVAVLITNDGLMENPIQFADELSVNVSTYKLFPQFFSNSNGRMVLLSANAQSVKTVTFQ